MHHGPIPISSFYIINMHNSLGTFILLEILKINSIGRREEFFFDKKRIHIKEEEEKER